MLRKLRKLRNYQKSKLTIFGAIEKGNELPARYLSHR